MTISEHPAATGGAGGWVGGVEGGGGDPLSPPPPHALISAHANTNRILGLSDDRTGKVHVEVEVFRFSTFAVEDKFQGKTMC